MAFSRTRITTEIEIGAPATDVWNSLVDLESYPAWNPLIRRISGNIAIGAKLDVTIQLPNSSAMKFEPTIISVETDKELRWVGKFGMTVVFRGEHFFTISDTEFTERY